MGLWVLAALVAEQELQDAAWVQNSMNTYTHISSHIALWHWTTVWCETGAAIAHCARNVINCHQQEHPSQ